MKRYQKLMNPDQVAKLVNRADALLEERRSNATCPPPPMASPFAAAPEDVRRDVSKRQHSKAPHPMNDAVTRVSSMPPPPEARPSDEPDDGGPRSGSGKKRRSCFQNDVETREIMRPDIPVFETESLSTEDSDVATQISTASPNVIASSPPARPHMESFDFSWAESPMFGETRVHPLQHEGTAGSRYSLMPLLKVTTLLRRRPIWILPGVVMAAILVLTGLIGLGPSKATSEESPPLETTPPPESTNRLTKPEVSPPEKEAAVPDSLPETPGPDTVLIHLEGVPNKGVVKVDGVVSTLPLRLPRSSEILTVTVATKKKHWRHRIVPDRDRHLPVRMKLKKNAIQ